MPKTTVRKKDTASTGKSETDPGAESRHGHVVAVGASAGGLKAIGELLAGLPAAFPAPIVVVLHLDPDHQSHLATLLQRETRLRVQAAKAGEKLVPGTVYVAPPDRHLEIRGDRIRLTRAARVRFSRPSIDRLFTSVATSYGDRAIGVVLSGSGSDGSVGAAIIKAHGGFVVAQDPGGAEFSSMPESAVATGCVDAALPVAEMPSILARAVTHKSSNATPPEWQQILGLLKKQFGTDFAGYRNTTLNRRLHRRMLATGRPELKAYVQLLRSDGDELQRLHSEFLIKVSGFFRNPKEWNQLAAKVVRPMVRQHARSREFRVWSAGCATGEEAYSLAILLSEALLKEEHPGHFKVFATDIDEQALATARHGVYTSGQLAGLSKPRRRTHFHQEGERFRVTKTLRKNVIFGRHDLLNDAPLASIDLLACRNVLIYFGPEKSKAAMQRLVYALRLGGFLFLGRSEGIGRAQAELERVDGGARIFKRVPIRHASQPSPTPEPAARKPRDRPQGDLSYAKGPVDTGELLLDASTVVAFGVNKAERIVVWNKAAAGFFDMQSSDAMDLPAPEAVGHYFWASLSKAVHAAGTGKSAIREARLVHGSPGGDRRYLDVEWLDLAKAGKGAEGILFLAVDATARHEGDVRERALDTAAEGSVHEHLSAEEAAQSANQELETLNEELQSSSEEQQTLIEELESRNEELQTVNEELQSLNEELNTLNEEVGIRISEADRLNAYLQVILDLAAQSIIGCDSDNRITFWNTVARKQFHLSQEQALGNNLFKLVPLLDTPGVRQLIRKTGRPAMVRVPRRGGHSGDLYVRMRVVRDGSGDRQGYCLRISSDNGEGTPAPRGTAKGKRKS